MKIRAQSNRQGHTIILTLVVCLVLGVVLLGVIKLANTGGQMTGRSQNWNNALPIAEAGIEEALTHLRYSPTNRWENGWNYDTSLVPPKYTKTQTLKDGYYKVTISTNHDPVIVSRAWLRAPGQKDYSIQRAIQVKTTNQPLFMAGMEGTTFVKLTKNMRVDSYDSNDPKHSSATGGYNQATAKDRGDVTSYGGNGSLDIGGAHVYGHIKTPPETAYALGGGSVGSFSWSGNGVEPGAYEEMPDPDYPPIFAPKPTATAPKGTGAQSGYQYVLGSAIYEVSAIAGSILITGNATLVVDDSIKLSGKEEIRIKPGGSLKIYMKGQNTSFTGQGDINPETPAPNLMYFGLPSNTGIEMTGNSAFNGVIYAPSAQVALKGGGRDGADFTGAIVAASVIANGHYSFHFDEATRRLGSRGIFAGSWDELDPNGNF